MLGKKLRKRKIDHLSHKNLKKKIKYNKKKILKKKLPIEFSLLTFVAFLSVYQYSVFFNNFFSDYYYLNYFLRPFFFWPEIEHEKSPPLPLLTEKRVKLPPETNKHFLVSFFFLSFFLYFFFLVLFFSFNLSEFLRNVFCNTGNLKGKKRKKKKKRINFQKKKKKERKTEKVQKKWNNEINNDKIDIQKKLVKKNEWFFILLFKPLFIPAFLCRIGIVYCLYQRSA